MKLHISSMVRGMPMFTGVEPLRGYKEYIGQHRIEPKDIKRIQVLLCSYSINYIEVDLADELRGLNDDQISLIIALFKFGYKHLTMSLIQAYALQLNITLSSEGFTSILWVLEKWGILFEQSTDGVIEYTLCDNNIDAIYAPEH